MAGLALSVPGKQTVPRAEVIAVCRVLELAKHVDSDGSGEIDLDELKVLLTPMMSLTDHASFPVELEPNYGICGGVPGHPAIL